MVEAKYDENRNARDEAISALNTSLEEGRKAFMAKLEVTRINSKPPIPATDPSAFTVSQEVRDLFAKARIRQRPPLENS